MSPRLAELTSLACCVPVHATDTVVDPEIVSRGTILRNVQMLP
jgi:hypothetical protein